MERAPVRRFIGLSILQQRNLRCRWTPVEAQDTVRTNAGGVHSMSSVRGRPRFYWFAIAAGCWMLVVYGNGIWSALTRQTIAGRPPISLIYRQGAWTISGVYPGGPADGVLRRGDRIVSIDGDPRGARIGPGLLAQFHQPGSYFDFG